MNYLSYDHPGAAPVCASLASASTQSPRGCIDIVLEYQRSQQPDKWDPESESEEASQAATPYLIQVLGVVQRFDESKPD